MRSLFESMAECLLFYLTTKAVFITGITSARRGSELHALMVDTPFTNFHKDKVILSPDPMFLPKTVSEFHNFERINLLVFFPRSLASKAESALHARRALAYYLDSTKSFRKSSRFLC